jgi:hypothetical protein
MTTTTTNLEARAIGREMAQSRQERLDYLQDEYQLDEQEARAEALELTRMQTTNQLQERPLRDLSWNDLNQIADEDATQALATWDRIKAEVQEEYQNGVRAGRALQAHGTSPRETAEFQVLRDELAGQHQPRSGIEQTLIDVLAQTYSSYLKWLARLINYTDLEQQPEDAREEGRWVAPRIERAKAIDQAAAMTDRFHKMYLRTLRALRDQRRYSPTLIVQTQQLNMAQQQCNITADQADRSGLLPS